MHHTNQLDEKETCKRYIIVISLPFFVIFLEEAIQFLQNHQYRSNNISLCSSITTFYPQFALEQTGDNDGGTSSEKGRV